MGSEQPNHFSIDAFGRQWLSLALFCITASSISLLAAATKLCTALELVVEKAAATANKPSALQL